MGSTLVGTTERSGLSVEQVGGNDVYKLLPQLQAVLEQGFGNSAQYRTFFAEPVEVDRKIDWYAEKGGTVEPVASLPPEERQKVLEQLKSLLKGIGSYAEKLRENDNTASKNYADILEKALVVPGKNYLDYVYSVDGQPVMIGWGFSEGNHDVVDGIRDLIKQVDNGLAEVAPKPQEEPAPAPAEPTPPPPPAASEAAPVPAPEPQPVAPPRKSRAWLWCLVVLLLLACAAAAWYFLAHKNAAPDTSVAFLKGEFTVNGLLENATNHQVDLRISIPGEDGKGIAYIIEPEQTCQGVLAATRDQNGVVTFAIDSPACPNNMNYPAFSLQCDTLAKGVNNGQLANGNYSCGYTGGGENWKLNITR